MKDIINNPALVAFCGLYCGACRRYLSDKCPGCAENTKAKWCGIRTCCIDNKYSSCAGCTEFKNADDCKKFNNFISKVFAFVFRSNRKACIGQIRSMGIKEHAAYMAENKLQSLKRI